MISFWPESDRPWRGTRGGHQIIRQSLFADASVGPRFEWRPLTDEYLVMLEQRHEELRDANLRMRVGVRIRVAVRDGVGVRFGSGLGLGPPSTC